MTYIVRCRKAQQGGGPLRVCQLPVGHAGDCEHRDLLDIAVMDAPGTPGFGPQTPQCGGEFKDCGLFRVCRLPRGHEGPCADPDLASRPPSGELEPETIEQLNERLEPLRHQLGVQDGSITASAAHLFGRDDPEREMTGGTIYGLTDDPDLNLKIQAAVKLAVADERERCALIARGEWAVDGPEYLIRLKIVQDIRSGK